MFNSDTCSLASQKDVLATGGYTLIRKLNSGTFANVYLAEFTPKNDPNERIILACKVVNYTKLVKGKVLSRKFIRRELAILTKLNHPYLISVHRILRWFNKYYIFMPYAENGDLLEYICASKDPIPEPQCCIWFRQLSLGLQYIHKMDIAHRDIKCENILLTSTMDVKLADFGFARYVVDENGNRILSDTYCGSVNYIAPEIVIGTPYDPKVSDMWSMGVILFAMLNRSVPFKVGDVQHTYQQQMNRRYKFRSKNVDCCSSQVKALVDNLLEPNVSLRWTVEQVLDCHWFAINSHRFAVNREEQEALNQAKEMKRKAVEERTANKHKPQGHTTVDDENNAGGSAITNINGELYSDLNVTLLDKETETDAPKTTVKHDANDQPTVKIAKLE